MSRYFIKGYINKNIGDDLMISLLKEKIMLYDKFADIRLLKGRKDILKYFYSSNNYIRIGGSFYQEYPFNNNRKSNRVIYKYLKLFNLIKRINNKNKIIFVNNSIGPIFTKGFEYEVLKVFSLADFISVRDNFSSDFLTKKRIKNIICPDSVFLLYELLNKDYCVKLKNTRKNILGISLLPFLELFYLDYQGQKIINNNIVRIISQLLEKNKYETIRFFEFCAGTENDKNNFIKIINLIKPNLRDKIQIINYSGDIRQFLNYMAGCSFFICNRFHSIILALILRIPFLAIDHHPKVYNFLVDNKLEEFRIDYRKFLESNCSDELVNLINSSSLQQRLSDKKLSELSNDALNNFSWLFFYDI
jgi:polysaccharide pyruvyl transferase WcaK-like protein